MNDLTFIIVLFSSITALGLYILAFKKPIQ